jgi:2-methylaconitate cis-trans-isomerase PrpF
LYPNEGRTDGWRCAGSGRVHAWGTSKELFFHAEELPSGPAARDRLLLAALGSPDPFGRQLDGMGGGISSLSKAVVVGRLLSTGRPVDEVELKGAGRFRLSDQEVTETAEGWRAESASLYRTARALMRGQVAVSAAR